MSCFFSYLHSSIDLDSLKPAGAARNIADNNSPSPPGFSSSSFEPDDFKLDRELADLDPEELGLLSSSSFGEVRDRAERFGDRLAEVLPELTTQQPTKGKITGQTEYRERPIGEWVSTCYSAGQTLFDQDGNTNWIPKESCGNYAKVCPHHARLEVSRRIDRYLPVLLESLGEDYELRFVTFGLPNRDQGQLEEMREETWDAWNRFRRRKAIEIEAGLVAEEVTVNPDDGSWNHHLHGIVAYDSWPDYKTIADTWQDVIGRDDAPAPQHEPIYGSPKKIKNAVKETIKYLSKFETGDEKDAGLGLLDWSEDHLEEWQAVFWGVRTLRTYGDWYNAKPDDDGEEDDDEFDEVGRIVTSWCEDQGKMTIDSIRVRKSTDPSVLAKVLNWDRDLIESLLEKAADPPDYSPYVEIDFARVRGRTVSECAKRGAKNA